MVASLIRIAAEDDAISDDTTLYSTRNMTKKDLAKSTTVCLEEFLGSIFLYVVRNVRNTDGKSCIKLISDAYIQDSLKDHEDLRITSKVLSAADDNNLKSRWGTELVAEAGGVCPNIGCSRPLIAQGETVSSASYDIIVIDDNKPSNDFTNLLAVCPECAASYRINRNHNTQLMLMKVKASLMKTMNVQSLLADQTLENDIINVLVNIPLTPAPDSDLNYIPVEIACKMKPESNGLLQRLRLYVDLYYQAVQDALQNLNRSGKNRFEPFCHKVRLSYLSLQDIESDQEMIFEHMVEWLQKETNGRRNACEIVIAYFVQKCEVFNVIPQ